MFLRYLTALVIVAYAFGSARTQAQLRAGVAKVDISRVASKPSGNTLYAKALVISDGTKTAVIVAVDAVAIAEIGSIRDPYLANVRKQLSAELGIKPEHVLINASHCHGSVHKDVEARTVQAVKMAAANMVPVTVGVGTGTENRIMENRRLILKSGRIIDVRHAYPLPPDDAVAAVGPVDTEIGILRLDRTNGDTLALLYNFAMHPIKGTPATAGDTADIVGFASKAIEENLPAGAMAFFIQGCGGDINPIRYKEVNVPRDAEPHGNLLALSTLRAARKIKTKPVNSFKFTNHKLKIPRADHSKRIEEMEAEKERLTKSLRGTPLNLKSFMSLYMKHSANGTAPSIDSYVYMRDEQIGRKDLTSLDERNLRDLERYRNNVHTMEALIRLLINKALLERHQMRNSAANMEPVEVEVVGLRIGDFRMVSFPGEVTVPIGLNIKKRAPHDMTFVAGYSNGYIYYCPTAEQLKNIGGAQEDSDCLIAAEWQALFENKALEILKALD